MYEMDKQKFGAFVTALRKEKGYTQKDLADMLYISNKAVSKWETGVSIPDTALLVPLAEALGITVTELLNCQRLPQDIPMAPDQTEALVKKVIGLTAVEQKKYPSNRKKRGLQLLLCTAIGLLEIGLLLWIGYAPEELSLSLTTMMLLMAFFGLYFCCFARETLPKYYDDNRISSFSDGFFRMNVPGVCFNNSNWPHILRVGQLWSMIGLVASPLLFFVMRTFFPGLWQTAWTFIILLTALGGLFLPIVIVGRKYEYAPDIPPSARTARRDWPWIWTCLVIVMVLASALPATGLATYGSGSCMGWSENKQLDNWNASFSYFHGYRQRLVNISGDPAALHIQTAIEEGKLGLLVTDLDDQVVYEGEFSEPAVLDIPIPGKVRVRLIGDSVRGSFSIAW